MSQSNTTQDTKKHDEYQKLYPFLLLTNDLIIRPLQEQDYEVFIKCLKESVGQIDVWLPWRDSLPNYENITDHAKQFYDEAQNYQAFHYSIFRNNRFIGMCSLYDLNMEAKTATLGYWATRDEQNQFYFVDAINALLQYCFQETCISTVEIPCVVGNYIAERAAKMLKFNLQSISITNNQQIKLFKIEDQQHLPKINLRWLVNVDSEPVEY